MPRTIPTATGEAPRRARAFASGFTLLALAACADKPPPPLDAGKIATVVIGRSTRSDVFASLGRPAHTSQSLAGESWVYEPRHVDSGNGQLVSGAGAAAGVVGAFVPFVGLAGPAIGLANAAGGPTTPAAAGDSLAVSFDAGGVVRDCVYTSAAIPAGLPGAASATAQPTGCQRSEAAATPSR